MKTRYGDATDAKQFTGLERDAWPADSGITLNAIQAPLAAAAAAKYRAGSTIP